MNKIAHKYNILALSFDKIKTTIPKINIEDKYPNLSFSTNNKVEKQSCIIGNKEITYKPINSNNNPANKEPLIKFRNSRKTAENRRMVRIIVTRGYSKKENKLVF